MMKLLYITCNKIIDRGIIGMIIILFTFFIFVEMLF